MTISSKRLIDEVKQTMGSWRIVPSVNSDTYDWIGLRTTGIQVGIESKGTRNMATLSMGVIDPNGQKTIIKSATYGGSGRAQFSSEYDALRNICSADAMVKLEKALNNAFTISKKKRPDLYSD